MEFRTITTSIFQNVYRLLSRFVFCDFSAVYLLDCGPLTVSQADGSLPAKNSDLRFASVSAQELLRAGGDRLDFSAEDARCLGEGSRCLAAYKGHTLVGYLWHMGGDIGAEMNTPGAPFQGFGLSLGDSTRYLFKVYVDEKYRGEKINQRLCRALVSSLRSEGVDYILTLTEWSNSAFRTSATSTGFTHIGNCAEWVLRGKSSFWFPRTSASLVRFVEPTIGTALESARS